MTDRELKELFEKKLAGQSHPVNLDNWRRMEAILDAGKPNLSFFWRSAALIVSAFSLALAFLPSSLPQPGPAINSAQPAVLPLESQSTAKPQSPAAEGVTAPAALSISQASRSDAVPSKNPLAVKGQQPPAPMALSAPASASSASALPEEENYFTPAIATVGEPRDWQALASLSAPSLGLLALEESDKEDPFWLGAKKPPLQGSFWLSAGTGINNSFNSEAQPGWQMGLHYQQPLSSRWAVEAGVQYQRSGSLGIERITDSVFFALGRTDVHTHEHFKSFSSLQFPIELAYRQGRHSLVAGATLSRLLAVAWDTERRVQVIKQDERLENFSRNQFHEQFATWRGAVSFSYRLQLSQRWQAEAQYIRQWSPTVKTENTGFSRSYRLQHLQLGLRYQLWKP